MIGGHRRPILRKAAAWAAHPTLVGVGLLASTLLALGWANSAWPTGYERFWRVGLTLGWGRASVSLDLRQWINQALMAIFFLVIGVEIKKSIVHGDLRTRRVAALPLLAAIGGSVLPAVAFLLAVGPGPESRGWAIPVATGIPFIVGILALLASRVPGSLRPFFLTLAIAEDVVAIVAVGVFYANGFSLWWFAAAVLSMASVAVLAALRVDRWPWFALAGFLAWLAMFESGVHPSVAGMVLGLLMPAANLNGSASLADRVDRRFRPMSGLLILPLFALANAGVTVNLRTLEAAFAAPLTWGIIVGLVVAKPVGVVVGAWVGLGMRLGMLPKGMHARHLPGLAWLAGLGFTVSLFVAGVAFAGQDQLLDFAKIGIIVASLASALLGSALLWAVGAGSRSRMD